MKNFINLYAAIVLVVLYGDVLKRFLSPMVALITLYSLSFFILIWASFSPRIPLYELSRNGAYLSLSALILIVLYSLQVFMPTPDFIGALSHALYMIVPLSFICIFSKHCRQFQLTQLAQTFLMLMIPINLVGLIQNYINPDFLISFTYASDDLGGVIRRNFLDDSFFLRYPSIFASADRYSAMGLMQLFFVLVLMKYGYINGVRSKLWVFFNIASAIVALFISGARSRILIAIIVAILWGITNFLKPIFSKKPPIKVPHGTNPLITFLVLGVGFGVLILFMTLELLETSSFPVISFLSQSIKAGDFHVRLAEALELSMLPDNADLVGTGLGSIGFGKPGEFGIQSMWLESGFIWGAPMLLMFIIMLYSLLRSILQGFFKGRSLDVAICSIPFLLLIFALLAGLTSTFELSTGILLGCSLPVLLRKTIVKV